ncbi:hypothetical protein L1987_56883 [Smallanthus sonchifolius]|uniref:Uncharacterized protein n=1 Tax=Smallanthus sonchifolius TaxID=185202 RepID=A0ACB9DC17_9ASTR|nr:hypothetical protein L1987_56883 [Smallanthus sonchifolius]
MSVAEGTKYVEDAFKKFCDDCEQAKRDGKDESHIVCEQAKRDGKDESHIVCLEEATIVPKKLSKSVDCGIQEIIKFWPATFILVDIVELRL